MFSIKKWLYDNPTRIKQTLEKNDCPLCMDAIDSIFNMDEECLPAFIITTSEYR